MKKEQIRKLAVGMAMLTTLCTTAAVPMEVQTVYAQDVQLPAETNSSFSKAREIESGVSVAGTLPDSGGMRYYKFSLEQAGKISIEIEKSSISTMNIKIYDSSQTEIYTDGSGSPSFSRNDIYLTGGNYYFSVEHHGRTTFSFVINIDSMGESFTETQDSNNDMSSDASSISLKTKYKGILAQNDDIDYYRFQAPAAGLITLNLTNSTSDTVKYAVYDDSMNPAYTNTVWEGNKISQSISVKSGDYYLAIAKNDVNSGTGSYTFSLDYIKKNTAAPKIKSVKNPSSGTISVKWSSVARASGYELWYSTDRKFKSNVTKKETSASETSATCYGLTRKNKYYARVRAYSEVNGIKEYGKWSSRKAVVIKK